MYRPLKRKSAPWKHILQGNLLINWQIMCYTLYRICWSMMLWGCYRIVFPQHGCKRRYGSLLLQETKREWPFPGFETINGTTAAFDCRRSRSQWERRGGLGHFRNSISFSLEGDRDITRRHGSHCKVSKMWWSLIYAMLRNEFALLSSFRVEWHNFRFYQQPC